MAHVNAQLHSAGVRHRVGVLQLEEGIYRDILAFLIEADQDLLEQIGGKLAAGRDTKRLNALQELVQERIAYMGQTLQDEHLVPSLLDLASFEVEHSAGSIENAIPVVWDLSAPSPSLLQAIVTKNPLAGYPLKDHVDTWSEAKRKGVMREINLGLAEGQTAEQIVKRVDTPLQTSKHGARAVVRTVSNAVTTQARELLYAGNEDIIKGVQWVATLDSRTTEVCRGMDGKVFPVDSGPRPPAHFSCRSTSVPVLKSWDELGIKQKTGAKAAVDESTADYKDPYDYSGDTASKVRRQMFDIDQPMSTVLDGDMAEAVREYTGSKHLRVNESLRKGYGLNAGNKMLVRDLDTAIRTSKVNHALTLYRGADYDPFTKLVEGDTFQDEAFVSTSFDKTGAFKRRQLIKITIPTNANAFVVDDLTDMDYEKEVILPRESKFRVVKVSDIEKGSEFDNGYSRKLIEVELVVEPIAKATGKPLPTEVPEEMRPFVREAMSGQVAGKVTYDEWLRGQDAAFQDEILGKVKGKLFREGGLTLDKFVDVSELRPYTLEELKNREAGTWKKIFGD